MDGFKDKWIDKLTDRWMVLWKDQLIDNGQIDEYLYKISLKCDNA